MLNIPKGVFKKEFYNPNARDSTNYSVVEDLAQTPCVILSLEFLQIFPSHRDAILVAISSMKLVILMDKFNFYVVKLCMSYHVAYFIHVVHDRKPIG